MHQQVCIWMLLPRGIFVLGIRQETSVVLGNKLYLCVACVVSKRALGCDSLPGFLASGYWSGLWVMDR